MVVTALRRSTCARSTDGRPKRPAPGTSAPLQYFAYPDWKSDRLRNEFPDGRYKAGADIGPDEWTNLRIDIDGTRLAVAVNGTEALRLTETKSAPAAGNIGLFVDIGSEFFSDLRVTPN
jgi:hypothetical protein